MKVRIVKCFSIIYWYRNNIGDVIQVMDDPDDPWNIDYINIQDGHEYEGYSLLKSDCEVVEQ